MIGDNLVFSLKGVTFFSWAILSTVTIDAGVSLSLGRTLERSLSTGNAWMVTRFHSLMSRVEFDGKEHLFRGLNLYKVVPDMVAGTDLTTELGIPFRNIPFETLCADG